MSAHLNTLEAELAAYAAIFRRESVAPLRFGFWSTPLDIVAAVCGCDDCEDCPPPPHTPPTTLINNRSTMEPSERTSK